MRRDEFNVKDEKSINEILTECEYGTLSLISDNKPYCVALNFVKYENSIFFHGSKEGKKIEAIKNNFSNNDEMRKKSWNKELNNVY